MIAAIACQNCGQTREKMDELTSCPSCGYAPQAKPPEAMDFVRSYFNDVWTIITRPGKFFRSMPTQGGLAKPLAFALVTHWLGTAIGFLWTLAVGGFASGVARGFFKAATSSIEIDYPGRSAELSMARDRVVDWIWGAGSVIADPFLTLLQILVTSTLVYLGVRLLVPSRDRETTFESTARIICYGTTPAILGALPVLGGFFASLITFIVTVIGVKETYKVGPGRAAVVVLFPKLLIFAMILGGVVLFAVALIQLVGAMIASS